MLLNSLDPSLGDGAVPGAAKAPQMPVCQNLLGGIIPAPSASYFGAFLSCGVYRRIIWGWELQLELLVLLCPRQHQLQL